MPINELSIENIALNISVGRTELLPAEDLDLESYLNTFNTEDTEDIDRIEGIYHIGELLSNSNSVEPPLKTSRSRQLANRRVKLRYLKR